MVSMKVVWQPLAMQDLRDIYDYYVDKASLKYAKELKKKILDSSKYLSKHPEMGQIEENTRLSKGVYRYFLVEENYKVLYIISETDINILGVFDNRQSPDKMKV
jgi:plasmid stabilization system protein ParE